MVENDVVGDAGERIQESAGPVKAYHRRMVAVLRCGEKRWVLESCCLRCGGWRRVPGWLEVWIRRAWDHCGCWLEGVPYHEVLHDGVPPACP